VTHRAFEALIDQEANLNENRLPKLFAALFAGAMTVALFHSVAMLAVEPQPATQLAAAPQVSAPARPTSAGQGTHIALASWFGHRTVAVR
jgi:hypothetical protein